MTWVRGSGRTASVNTGPNNDHTFGNKKGHYMYIETSWKKENDTARYVGWNSLWKLLHDSGVVSGSDRTSLKISAFVVF